MSKKILFIKSVFIEGLELFRRSFLKTTSYQIIFKTAFLSILIMLAITVINAFFDFTKTKLIGEKQVPVLFLQFKHIATITIAITLLLIGHFIEKVGLIIITSFYFKFKNISYFQIYKQAIKKTPGIIFLKIKETKYLALLLPVIFFLWTTTTIIGTGGQISSSLYPLLIISIIIFAFIIYVRRIFSSYIACLEPNESPVEFHKKTTRESRIMKGWVLFIWYCIFISAIVILFFLIFWIIKFSLDVIISFAGIDSLAFFLAFAISSITFLIIFIPIVLNSFRSSLYTVLYYKERERQGKYFKIEDKNAFETSWIAKYGKKFIALGFFIIFVIISLLLTSSIQNQINNLEESVEKYEHKELSLKQATQEIKKIGTTDDKIKATFDIVSILLFDLAQESIEDKNNSQP